MGVTCRQSVAGTLIASFGDARLLKFLDGRYELVGGSQADREEAKKWISEFLRNVMVKGLP